MTLTPAAFRSMLPRQPSRHVMIPTRKPRFDKFMPAYWPMYRIAYDGEHTYTVVYQPTSENLSHHETASEARAAAHRYHAADKRRTP